MSVLCVPRDTAEEAAGDLDVTAHVRSPRPGVVVGNGGHPGPWRVLASLDTGTE